MSIRLERGGGLAFATIDSPPLNLFNRANFDVPNRIFGSPSFGQVSSARNPREMQFGLRLSF